MKDFNKAVAQAKQGNPDKLVQQLKQTQKAQGTAQAQADFMRAVRLMLK